MVSPDLTEVFNGVEVDDDSDLEPEIADCGESHVVAKQGSDKCRGLGGQRRPLSLTVDWCVVDSLLNTPGRTLA
jgi:hypothetical protein